MIIFEGAVQISHWKARALHAQRVIVVRCSLCKALRESWLAAESGLLPLRFVRVAASARRDEDVLKFSVHVAEPIVPQCIVLSCWLDGRVGMPRDKM